MAHQKKITRQEADRHEVVKQIRELSSGTIASLTGERHYETIEVIRDNFRIFTIGALMSGKDFDRWQDAWKYYEDYAKKQSGHMGANRPKTRTVGDIFLTLKKDKSKGWILDVERMAPSGGKSFRQDYWFEDEANAEEWFGMIHNDHDIVSLHRESDLPPINPREYPGMDF